MQEKLIKNGINIDKLITFDGDISEYNDNKSKYDLLFIDGEHTDIACFRDFIYGEKLLRKKSIIIFHDSWIVLKAIRLIQEYLTSKKVLFKFLAIKNSSVSIILLDKFSQLGIEKLFDYHKDLDKYYKDCQKELLQNIINNKLIVKLELK